MKRMLRSFIVYLLFIIASFLALPQTSFAQPRIVPICRTAPNASTTTPATGPGSTVTTQQNGQTVSVTQGLNVGESGINVDTIKLSQPIDGVFEIQASGGIPRYIALVFRYMIGVVGTVATIMVVYGGFRYLLGASGGDVARGKEIIRDAIVGMILVLSAYAILYTINPDTVALRGPNITPIKNVALKTDDLINRWSNTCVTDLNCAPGKVCLLSRSLNGPDAGQCTSGGRGERCRCVGTGCGIARDNATARGSVNNCFTVNDRNAELQCQPGLSCGAYGGFRCSYFDPTSEANADYVCGDSLAFSPCDMRRDPPQTCGITTDSSHTPLYCLQGTLPGCNIAGICLHGDWRDDQFVNTASDSIDASWHPGTGATPENGGCVRDAVNPDEMQTQVKCNANAKCMQSTDGYASRFDSTVNYYLRYNLLGQLDPDLTAGNFMRYGCRKMVGSTCSGDNECPSKCINGTCTGFCYLRIRDSANVPPPNQIQRIDGIFDPAQLVSQCTEGCEGKWSLIKDYLDEVWETSGPALENKRQAYANAATIMGGLGNIDYVKSTCYPKRPNNTSCVFNAQCQSNRCNYPQGSPPPTLDALQTILSAIIQNPTNTNIGPGTCL